MEIDLLNHKCSKKELVYLFVKEHAPVRTSEVIRFGSEIYSNRAHRDLQQLSADGYVRGLDDFEKMYHGFKGKEKIWKLTEKELTI